MRPARRKTGRLAAASLAALAAGWAAGCDFGSDGQSESGSRIALVRGEVRDSGGRPIPGAVVRQARSGRRTRADRRGRFELELRGSGAPIVASSASHVPQTRRLARRIDFSLWAVKPGADAPRTNSADRIIFWVGCGELVRLSDSQLEQWKRSGVDGFVCMVDRLQGLGGSQDFTGDAGRTLRAPRYRLQRGLRDTRLAKRARSHGLRIYLGAKLVNYYNAATPLSDWFDDKGWSKTVLPSMANLAGAAKRLGFTGLAFDQELYPQRGGTSKASWDWDYPGNSRSEKQVRAKAKQRGAQTMRTLVKRFPALELVAYDTKLPRTWEALVQEEVNGQADAYARRLHIDFWDGLSSVRGYRAIRWMDAIFYKTPHLSGHDWDEALRYNAASVYSLLSREFSGWNYASSRLHLSPFSWIDEGPSPGEFDDAQPVGDIAEQLQAFRRWGTGGEFANFAFARLRDFDYARYTGALRAASRPGTVDSDPPELTLDAAGGGDAIKVDGETVDLGGSASDNFAIRAVRWRDDEGREGVAQLSLSEGADERSADSVQWSVEDLPVDDGTTRIWLRAEDIKGLGSVRSVRVAR